MIAENIFPIMSLLWKVIFLYFKLKQNSNELEGLQRSRVVAATEGKEKSTFGPSITGQLCLHKEKYIGLFLGTGLILL